MNKSKFNVIVTINVAGIIAAIALLAQVLSSFWGG